jgi:hypothetical protein
MSGLSMEEFLGHRTSGGGAKVLKNWKEDGKILVWLHQRAGIHCLWRHPFYRRVELKDKPPEIWPERFNCFEVDANGNPNEEVLVNRYRRDKDTKARLFSPTCGFCRFEEDLYQSWHRKELSWTDEVFRFRAGQKTTTLHVGGVTGLFRNPKLTDDEKAEIANIGVFQKEAWKYDTRVKPEYLFCVAVGNDPKSGIQKAIQPQGLGDKMKIEIGKQIKARGPKGDPTRNPYPFLWEYSESGSFDDAYTVTAMTEEKPSPEILALINSDPPDVSTFTRGQSKKLVRTALEQACVLDVDWDDYFPPGELEQQPREEAPAEQQTRTPEVKGPQEDDDMCACDQCGEAMKASATKCPHCGKSYVVEAATPPKEVPLPPPPPPLKKRSEAMREKERGEVQQKESAGPGITPDMFGGDASDLPF